MKKCFMVLMALAVVAMAGFTMAAVEKGMISLKAGDEVYVCGCGTACPCETISRKAGNCSCKKALVEAKVTKVEDGKAFATVNGEERSFKTTGSYQCACGPKCNCDTISQKLGKCACGKEMEKVK